MNGIRAFVGHSFTDDDHEIVEKLLNYFKQLSTLYSKFSWDHAEAAEPKELAKKVQTLMTDKNVFIGICTKKEQVIKPSALKSSLFSSGSLKARRGDFEWKTADWIIQEIGLAIGKNLDLILLVEDGVRPPGGLQGNIEYISFARSSLDRTFGKILEMITALTPKLGESSAVVSQSAAAKTPEVAQSETEPGDNWLTPKPEWERKNYEFAIFHAIAFDDNEATVKINGEYLKTDEAKHSDNKLTWEARQELDRVVLGKGGTIDRLQRFSDENPDSEIMLIYLAQAFEHFGEHLKAAGTYESAANKTSSDTEKLWPQSRAAIAYSRANNAQAASVISSMKQIAEATGSGEMRLLKTLNEIAGLTNDNNVSVALMERMLELDGSDNDIRFSLAYKYSQNGREDLSLLHYLKIPYSGRTAMAWNNLGVTFDEFSMPAKAADAFRAAEAMGETLAMSNLAGKLISIGFLNEARGKCETALAIKGYHKNVGRNLARIGELPEEEEKKQLDVVEKAKPSKQFYAEFGRASSRPEPTHVFGLWKSPDCILTLTLGEGHVLLEGSYDQPISGLLFAAMMPDFGTNTSKSVRYRIKYNGKLHGRAIEGEVTRTRDDGTKAPGTVLGGSADDPVKALMYLSDMADTIEVMEGPGSRSPKIYRLAVVKAN